MFLVQRIVCLYYVVQITVNAETECGGDVDLFSDNSSYLVSSSFRKTQTNCKWNIQVPLGNQVKFVFENFLSLDNVFNCSDIYFEIKDVNGINRYCQNGPLSQTYTSQGPLINAKLYSLQTRENDEGIRVRMQFQTAPCQASINDFSTGTIFSPNYPEYYPNDRTCTWKLQVPNGFAIYMDCTRYKFWIENSNNCESDVLLVSLNGRDDFADGVPFCGRRPPPPFTSFDNTLTILFKSNPWYHYTGFRCDFQAVPIGVTGTPVIPTQPTEMPPIDPNVCGVCGIANNELSRVVGGSETRPNQYPWTVVIFQRIANTTTLQQFCGGSLLNDRYVLTAAHCFRNRTINNIMIGLSEHDITAPVKTSAIKVSVSQVVINPTWGTTQAATDSDVAIVKLSRSITYSSAIRPICLPPTGLTFQDETATVAGWGRYEVAGNRSSKVLRAVNIQVLPLSDCENAYGQRQITNNMICAAVAQPVRDACPGDSGGPLMWFKGGKWYLIGVVSAGDPRGVCGNPQFPGIYTRVSNFLDWIGQNIQGDSNCSTQS